MDDWFLISKKTVVALRTELIALKTKVCYQDTQRDKDITLNKIETIIHSLDSGLFESNVVPAECHNHGFSKVDEILTFIDMNTVDDDFDVMNELKTMLKRL